MRIEGSDLGDASEVMFGGIPAESFNVKLTDQNTVALEALTPCGPKRLGARDRDNAAGYIGYRSGGSVHLFGTAGNRYCVICDSSERRLDQFAEHRGAFSS